ncbi:hypothetical protein [Streptomyces smaragdinus]|nr:hypothetical protein [Streptomyces smaragdinus]
MPLEAQFAFADLLPHLEQDPDTVTEAHGLDVPGPVRMRSTVLPGTLAVFLISDTTGEISLVQVTTIP